MSTQHPTSPPKLCSDTSTAKNSSYCCNKQASLDKNVDGKILQILDDLLNLFSSETIFNLNGRVLTDAGFKILEKGLDFAPLQRKINESELK